MDGPAGEIQLNDKPIDILLVDDNESDIKITVRTFERAKVKNNIYVVNDGHSALDFVSHQGAYQDTDKYPRPGLILLDINMPKMDGFEVLRRLKGNPESNFIPVAMLTSSRNEHDVLKSYQYGAVSYIPKPINFEAFLKVVEGFNFYWHVINKLPQSDNEGGTHLAE